MYVYYVEDIKDSFYVLSDSKGTKEVLQRLRLAEIRLSDGGPRHMRLLDWRGPHIAAPKSTILKDLDYYFAFGSCRCTVVNNYIHVRLFGVAGLLGFAKVNGFGLEKVTNNVFKIIRRGR